MSQVLDRVVTSKAEAHIAAQQAYTLAQILISDGKPVHIRAEMHEEDRTLRANRFYWGVVLREISEQAQIGGQRWTVDAWHELGKRQFLGFEIKKVRVAGKKRPVVIRRLRSTTTLKIRAFSKYLEEVMAFAAVELGVRFSMQDWQEYRG